MDDLLNSAPCGFLVFTDDGTVQAVNTTLLNLLEYQADELQGRHVQSIFSVGGRVFYQTHFFPLLKLHGKAEEIYFDLRSKGGKTLPVLANAVRRERDGAMLNDCVFVPIHQRNQYEDEILLAKKAAEEANAAKAKFLSMMSHDLRTPLSSIIGFTDIIAKEMHGPTTVEQQDDLRRIKKASQYLLTLINDILNFARMEAGQVAVKVEAVPVCSVLDRAESLILPLLQEADLEYAREGCAPDLAVQADADRLQQVLLNLLTNAIKFTGRKGRVAVGCQRDGSEVRICIRDTGCGIGTEHIQRIFEPFVQVDAQQIASNQRGVGLGLAISREWHPAFSRHTWRPASSKTVMFNFSREQK